MNTYLITDGTVTHGIPVLAGRIPGTNEYYAWSFQVGHAGYGRKAVSVPVPDGTVIEEIVDAHDRRGMVRRTPGDQCLVYVRGGPVVAQDSQVLAHGIEAGGVPCCLLAMQSGEVLRVCRRGHPDMVVTLRDGALVPVIEPRPSREQEVGHGPVSQVRESRRDRTSYKRAVHQFELFPD